MFSGLSIRRLDGTLRTRPRKSRPPRTSRGRRDAHAAVRPEKSGSVSRRQRQRCQIKQIVARGQHPDIAELPTGGLVLYHRIREEATPSCAKCRWPGTPKLSVLGVSNRKETRISRGGSARSWVPLEPRLDAPILSGCTVGRPASCAPVARREQVGLYNWSDYLNPRPRSPTSIRSTGWR